MRPAARCLHCAQASCRRAGAKLQHASGHHRGITPEATAVNLIDDHNHAPGLDQVATLLSEVAEVIDPEKLALAARTAPVAWAQRLGHLLDQVGGTARTAALREYVIGVARQTVPLLPGAADSGAMRDARWKVLVNAEVEAEL